VWSTISLAVAFLALADLVVQVRDLRGRLQNLEHSRGADRRHRVDLEDQSGEGAAGAGQSEVIIAGAVRTLVAPTLDAHSSRPPDAGAKPLIIRIDDNRSR